MGWVGVAAMGEFMNVKRIVLGRYHEGPPHLRPKRRWEDNINMCR
jgi:hypothetical protein